MIPETIWPTLGIAAPLVAILFALLTQATNERKEITTKFLNALTDTVARNTSTTERIEQAMRAAQDHHTKEHERVLSGLDLIAKKLGAT